MWHELTCNQIFSQTLCQTNDLAPYLIPSRQWDRLVLSVQRVKHILILTEFDLPEKNGVWMMNHDIVSRLPRAIWVHKNELPLAKHRLHRVVLYLYGDSAFSRNVDRVDRC